MNLNRKGMRKILICRQLREALENDDIKKNNHDRKIIEIKSLIEIENISISISDIGIGKLQKNRFNGLSNLNEINLEYNKLKKLPYGVFESLSNLRLINLGKNV